MRTVTVDAAREMGVALDKRAPRTILRSPDGSPRVTVRSACASGLQRLQRAGLGADVMGTGASSGERGRRAFMLTTLFPRPGLAERNLLRITFV